MSCESNRYSHSVYPCVSATGNNQYKVPVTCWLIQIRSSGNDHSSQNNLLSRLTYLSWEPYGATMPSMQTQSLPATTVGVKSPGVVVSHPPAWARYVSGKSPGLWKVTRKNRKHHVNAIVEDLPKRVWNNDFPASAAWISASAARVPAKLNPQPRPAKNSLGNRRARQNIKTPHACHKNKASQSLHVLSNMLKNQSAQLHATSRRLSAGQDDLTQVHCRLVGYYDYSRLALQTCS